MPTAPSRPARSAACAALQARRPFPRPALLLALAAALPCTTALAQPAWPSKPVRIVSPLAPGGPVDLLARLIAAGIQERHGQAAIVENLSGGNGIIGMDNVRRSAADGHVLVVAPSGSLTITPTLVPKLPYSIERDFAPIAMLARSPNILVAHPSTGIGSVRELVALARAKPDALSFASPAVGSGLHLAGELFRQQTGADILHVPYKGTGPALADVLSGHVPLMMGSLHSLLPHVRAGKLRAVGITDSVRSPAAPDIATLSEQGAKGVIATSWYGLLAPGGTPAATIAAIAADLPAIMDRPAAREQFNKQGLVPWSMSPAAFRDHIAAERASWAKVIRERGIALE
jgi:tripartite-type tricarboxylate transporter receptor subunit TctC